MVKKSCVFEDTASKSILNVLKVKLNSKICVIANLKCRQKLYHFEKKIFLNGNIHSNVPFCKIVQVDKTHKFVE